VEDLAGECTGTGCEEHTLADLRSGTEPCLKMGSCATYTR